MGNCCTAPPADDPYQPAEEPYPAPHQPPPQAMLGHVTHVTPEDMVDLPYRSEPQQLEHIADREGEDTSILVSLL